MKNKIDLKKYLFVAIILSICFILINIVNSYNLYQKYNQNVNKKLSKIIYKIKEKYPNITDKEINDILNSNKDDDTFLKQYGINQKNDSVVKKNETLKNKYIVINSLIYIISFSILIILLILYDKTKSKKMDDITRYIEEINKRNYKINMDDMSEDELSILKQEIYKITIMLKENAINSNKDKIELKKSLEDISHQLKTPLTSIIIMLDNIIDNPKMDAKTKDEFISDIKREVENINFLVQSLLKLSKFDSNTINFNSDINNMKDILDKVVKNISVLCDLKNVKISLKVDDVKLKCDFMWQVEAITNIVKNCVEHSYENSAVEVNVKENSAYIMLTIKNKGETIDKKDISHIFERFYKGKNAKSDSIGIGLSLAKSIIEHDNGKIQVESRDNETVFTIRYFKI